MSSKSFRQTTLSTLGAFAALTLGACSGGGSAPALPSNSSVAAIDRGTIPVAPTSQPIVVATHMPTATPTTAATATPQPAATPPPVTPIGNTSFAPAGTQPYASGPFDRFVADPQIVVGSDAMIAAVTESGALGSLTFSTMPAGNPNDGMIPIYTAHNSDPHYTIHCMYFTHCPIEGHDVAIPRGARPSGNLGYASFTDDGSHDQHLAVRNLDSGREDDLWLAPQPNDAGGVLNVGYGNSYDLHGEGVGAGGATAAGFSLSNGRVRAIDLIAGRIPYALALITPCENGHVAPATGDDSGKDAGCPPIGAHVWLDSTPAEIASSGASPDNAAILRAMHEYGGYITDRCTYCNLGVSGESGLSYTSFGLQSPWLAIASMHPAETTSRGVYHLAVATGAIDLKRHLHIIAN